MLRALIFFSLACRYDNMILHGQNEGRNSTRRTYHGPCFTVVGKRQLSLGSCFHRRSTFIVRV